MIRSFVQAVLRFPTVVIGLACVIVGAGLWAYFNLDIEAYPDPVPPYVDFIVQPSGWAAEEVERYVTVPIETALNGAPGLDHVRSISEFGLADIKAYFKWGTNRAFDEQQALNRLALAQLPNNLQAQLNPDNAIGEIFRYTVEGPYDLTTRKVYQDWVLEKAFKQVEGVIDVSGFGGLTKQFQVLVDPTRLKAHGISLATLIQAVGNSNVAVGGNVVPLGEQAYNVRGLGLLAGTTDLENVVVAAKGGTPVRVKDVAQVVIGAAQRLGKVGREKNDDVVQGIVLMRPGGDTLKTIAGVHKRIAEIERDKLLPPGMRIRPYYDRKDLVDLTTHTVLHNVVVGILLVFGVLLLFLGNVRAAVITAINIPLALLFAFIFMVVNGTPANLISLGAVDFGIIVDSTVIMVENIFRHLSHGQGDLRRRIADAAGEVGKPLGFSTVIIGLAFLPLFLMTGVSRVIFSPMAYTYSYAIGGAILLSLTLAPVLMSLAMKTFAGQHSAKDVESEGRVSEAVLKWYRPVFRETLKRPVATALGGAGVLLLIGVLVGSQLGREFLPKLEEGNFWIRASMPLSISFEAAERYATRIRAILAARQEVVTAVSQLGRPDDGTDVAGFYNIELFVPLKPHSQWESHLNKEELTEILQRQLTAEFPGINFNFSQNIEDNVEEALSGVKGENTVKVIGPDLAADDAKAKELAGLLKTVKGVEDLAVVETQGQPNIQITPDRSLAARYGINVSDINAVVQAAVGGQAVTQVFEGEKRFDVVVRYRPEYRANPERIREIIVSSADGSQNVPLAQIAKVELTTGPSLVYRENNARYVPVKFSVRGRDLGTVIAEAQAKIKEKMQVPYDMHLDWAGEINELNEAKERLAVVVPLSLTLIAILVYFSVGTLKDTVAVLGEIPLACIGGVLALAVTGVSLSVSAAMGFISIFGIAVQDGLLVVNYAQQLWSEGHSLTDGAKLAAERRLRPVLMTTLVAMIGLLPAALSTEIGAQAQRPLAIVVIGGATMLVITRWLLPAWLVMLHGGRGGKRAVAEEPATPETATGGR